MSQHVDCVDSRQKREQTRHMALESKKYVSACYSLKASPQTAKVSTSGIDGNCIISIHLSSRLRVHCLALVLTLTSRMLNVVLCVVGDVHCTESGHLPTQTSSDLLSSDMYLIATTNKDDCFSALLSLVRVVGALIRLTMPTNLYSLYPSHYKHHFYPSYQDGIKTGSFMRVGAAAVSGTTAACWSQVPVSHPVVVFSLPPLYSGAVCAG